jgi:Fic family protein
MSTSLTRTTGVWQTMRFGGETVRAFVPLRLPPEPALQMGGTRQRLLERATLALGRLDSVCTLLPEPQLFLYTYVRREAVLSSQIEGTQSSLSDLLLHELQEVAGVPLDDVTEVSNYVRALEYGMDRLHSGFPLCARLLREMHAELMAGARESEKGPGEFRSTQNWIGGTRPGNAHFVPPPPDQVLDAMSDLERFLNDEEDGLPILIKAGLAHVQFETIHPFLDGNGRLGRLLIALILHDKQLLQQPLLYLSLYLKRHRARYYELLDRVRQVGDWEGWLDFFLEGVEETALGAVNTVRRLDALFERDRVRLQALGRQASNALLVFHAFRKRPILNVTQVAAETKLSFPTANTMAELLVREGIVREVTGKQRNRLFVYQEYLNMLDEGGAPDLIRT